MNENLHHSRQIGKFFAQIAFLRRDFEPYVTKYNKIQALMNRSGQSQTQNIYDCGGEGGQRGDRHGDDQTPLRFELLCDPHPFQIPSYLSRAGKTLLD